MSVPLTQPQMSGVLTAINSLNSPKFDWEKLLPAIIPVIQILLEMFGPQIAALLASNSTVGPLVVALINSIAAAVNKKP